MSLVSMVVTFERAKKTEKTTMRTSGVMSAHAKPRTDWLYLTRTSRRARFTMMWRDSLSARIAGRRRSPRR